MSKIKLRLITVDGLELLKMRFTLCYAFFNSINYYTTVCCAFNINKFTYRASQKVINTLPSTSMHDSCKQGVFIYVTRFIPKLSFSKKKCKKSKVKTP